MFVFSSSRDQMDEVEGLEHLAVRPAAVERNKAKHDSFRARWMGCGLGSAVIAALPAVSQLEGDQRFEKE
jgi:hypothetical protein